VVGGGGVGGGVGAVGPAVEGDAGPAVTGGDAAEPLPPDLAAGGEGRSAGVGEREAIRSWTSSHVIGDPATVRAGLEDLVVRTGADELMLTTMLHSTEDRIASYRLVADELALVPAA